MPGLFFQKGQLQEAKQAIKEAERAWEESEGHLTLGHSHWCKGRLAELEGDNAWALNYYKKAQRQFKNCDPRHAELSRVLVRMAFITLQIAIQGTEQGDQEEHCNFKPEFGLVSRDQRQILISRAKRLLGRAKLIYAGQNQRRGLGDVHRTVALIYIATGDLRKAEREASRAVVRQNSGRL